MGAAICDRGTSTDSVESAARIEAERNLGQSDFVTDAYLGGSACQE